MKQIIELENNDDITSIRSRIDFVLPELTRQAVQEGGGEANRPRLLLLVPRQNKALHSLVNMKLLARAVNSRAVAVALVSNNPTIRDFAREAGLKVFGSRRAAKWAGWIASDTPVAATALTLPPPAAPEMPAAPTTASRRRNRRARKKYVVLPGESRTGRLKYIAQQLGMLILIVMLAFVLVIGFIGLVPQATVTVTPLSKPVETELIVKADPDVDTLDYQTLTFPARREQVELRLSGEIETIKTELTPVDPARGQVTFINRTEIEQTIPATTTVAATAGEAVEFVTTISATIPAGIGSTASASIIAVEPGRKGNVAAGQINRFTDPGFNLLARVTNESGTSGGDIAPARIVTEDDKPRLDAYLRQKVQQEGLAELKAALGEQEFIPPESVEVIVLDIKYKEFSGDFSDTFTGEIQAVVRSTVIGGYNANRLALAALERQVPPGYKLDVAGLSFGAGEVLAYENGIATFRIFASGQAVPIINGAAIAEDIAWLPIGDAQTLLAEQYDLAGVPGIDLQPDWLVDYLGRLPFSPLRIRVFINEAVTALTEGN
jgi:hypothetical protein